MSSQTIPKILAGISADPRAERVKRLLSRIHNPMYEGADTIFILRAEADAVRLRTFMPRFPPPPPFSRVPGTDLWFLRVRLPATARIEYRLAVGRGEHWHDVADPLNPPEASNPFGVNSVAGGPAYRRPAWSQAQDGVAGGKLTEIRVAAIGKEGRRRYHLYLPAGYHRQPLPLLVVHDGSDYLHHAALATVLDNLIAGAEIEPVIALLLDPADRLIDYAANPDHARHLVEEVVPHLERRYRLVADRRRRVLMGASMGAVAALATAWNYPDEFGGLLLQSGSFVRRPDRYQWHGEPPEEPGLDLVFAPVARFLEELATDLHMADCRVFVSAGRYEGVIDYNRRLVPRLRWGGLQVEYRESWDGHHWGSWRDRLRDGLTFLLPSPSASPAES